ncbi:hypothetical protein HaLaN_11041 [Haematococcus lacustris]|uniref:Uncharacterized protein n=1 Tax=Haematococcus lacustris TaxID=44745 RepID=A0A699Z7S7_HAELA|nr:hypothetical protein HaLaN_11041 [Haematococcus lacustris]
MATATEPLAGLGHVGLSAGCASLGVVLADKELTTLTDLLHKNAAGQVIKVPEGAVLRGCKKTRRKLREHLRLRAEIHSQLRVIASLLVLRIFLTCL